MKQIAPLIDTRNFKALLDHLRSMAPFYVPEWHAWEEKGPGIALAKIYIHFYEHILRRLNRAPDKNFVAFLDTIGIDLQPAQSATVQVTFTLAEGAVENVLAEKGAQVTAAATNEAGESQELIFETGKNIAITPAKLLHAFSVVAGPADDKIYDHTPVLTESVPFKIFGGTDLQEHSIYIGHTDLLNQNKPADINVGFLIASGTDGGDGIKLVWEYLSGNHWVNLATLDDSNDSSTAQALDTTNRFQSSGEFRLKKTHLGEIGETEIFGKKSRWIRCRLTNPATAAAQIKLPVINTVRLSVNPANPFAPDLAFNNDIELDVGAINVKMRAKEIDLSFLDLSPPMTPPQRDDDTIYLHADDELKENDFIIFDNLLDKKEVRRIKKQPLSLGFGNFEITVDKKLEFNYQPYHRPTMLTALRTDGGDTELHVDSLEGLGVESGNKVYLIRESAIDDSLIRSEKVTIENAENGSDDKTRLTISRSPDSTRRSAFIAGDTVKIIPKIKPFGEVPRLFDTFYIASNEAFSKKGADIILYIDSHWHDCLPSSQWCSPPEVAPTQVLIWEYFNDETWRGIRVKDLTNNFRQEGTIAFTCPKDIAMVEVNGEEMFWIRVRLIDGDFGREVVIEDNGNGVITKKGTIHYPIINELTIRYNDFQREPEYCLGANNLDFVDHTQDCIDNDKTFAPFKELLEPYPGLFLGFDKPLSGGPLRILFSVKEQLLPGDSRLKMQWTLWSGKKWLPLNVEDETASLTKVGILTFTGSRELEKSILFGQKDLFWLKGSVVEGSHPEDPEIRGIFPNTVSAFQAAAVEDEILGTSEGTAGQVFGLLKFPIISQEVWVKESSQPDEEGRRAIVSDEGEDAIKLEKDETGEVTGVWVRWHAVDDLDQSFDRSRHYTVDRRLGKIKFGDGINGMVPPPGADNIKADYKFGGGKIGNIPANAIAGLKNAIPFVNAVSNHLVADGGSETETLEQVLVRGPRKIKHRRRAMSSEDFEALAKDAARIVARAKCLPNVDEEGLRTPGWVTVMIIPESAERAPKPSLQLIKVVKENLKTHCANTVSAPDHIYVRPADYTEVVVEIVAAPVSLDEASLVEGRIRQELERFIHPLTGGLDRSGWPFGNAICRSELFGRLEGIEGVNFIKSMHLFKDGRQQMGDIELNEFTLPYSGEHRIEIRMTGQEEVSEKNWTASECLDEV